MRSTIIVGLAQHGWRCTEALDLQTCTHHMYTTTSTTCQSMPHASGFITGGQLQDATVLYSVHDMQIAHLLGQLSHLLHSNLAMAT